MRIKTVAHIPAISECAIQAVAVVFPPALFATAHDKFSWQGWPKRDFPQMPRLDRSRTEQSGSRKPFKLDSCRLHWSLHFNAVKFSHREEVLAWLLFVHHGPVWAKNRDGVFAAGVSRWAFDCEPPVRMRFEWQSLQPWISLPSVLLPERDVDGCVVHRLVSLGRRPLFDLFRREQEISEWCPLRPLPNGNLPHVNKTGESELPPLPNPLLHNYETRFRLWPD